MKKSVVVCMQYDLCYVARQAALNSGTLDVKLSQHLEEKKQSIVDTKKAIEEQKKLAEQLTEEIERAEKERQEILAEKQRIIDELTERVNVSYVYQHCHLTWVFFVCIYIVIVQQTRSV
jgi:hypothetical protein